MTSRIIRSATLPVVVLAVLSCSKTQDTAPERRLFGDPPIIRSVSFEHTDDNGFDVPGFGTQTFIKCDFTEIVVRQACEHGYPGVTPIAGVAGPTMASQGRAPSATILRTSRGYSSRGPMGR